MADDILLIYRRNGEPLEVLEAETQERREPMRGEVEVGLEYSVIHPSDFGMIAGSYGRTAELPAVPGREGVGIVTRVGSGVAGIREGDRVALRDVGAWASWHCIDAQRVTLLPEGLDPTQLAQALVNPPTALQLLRTIPLRQGDWIIQNAATSAVGLWVIGLCRRLGYRSLNVVRSPARVDELKELGADVVVTEDSGYEKELRSLTGGPRPLLGLNSIGGESAIRLIKSLADGGTMVTFGGMVGDLVRFPTRYLIFNSITLRGFWMDKWVRSHYPEEVAALYNEVFEMMREGVARVPVDSVFPLKEYKAALQRAAAGGRSGKVLFAGPLAGS